MSQRIKFNDSRLTYDDGCYELNGEPFTGFVYKEYENGKLMYELEVKDGIYDGLSLEWYENEELKSRKSYEKDSLQGIHQEWDKNGQLKSESKYYYSNLVNRKIWNNNGVLVEYIKTNIEEYFADTRVFIKRFYENHRLKEETWQQYGVTMEKKEWDEKGELITHYEISNDPKYKYFLD